MHAGLVSAASPLRNGASQAHPPRWTGETPTPTATPTPTPTPAPAPFLPAALQHPAPPWFQAYLPREVALELLTHEEVRALFIFSLDFVCALRACERVTLFFSCLATAGEFPGA